MDRIYEPATTSAAEDVSKSDGQSSAPQSVSAGRGTSPVGCLATQINQGPGGHRFFGDYELLEEIGRGGMGVIFRARQRSLNRIVAVKILLAGPLADGELLERFRAESEAVAQLQHPNIVAIHEAGDHDGTAFYVMEYVPGCTLANLVEQRPLSPEVGAQYIRTVAVAIHYAHQRGILHRDLKPSNVLIDAANQPRVTDFGLAKRFVSDSRPCVSRNGQPAPPSQLTVTGQVLGSPSYISPEQAGAMGGHPGPGSDIYSLGAVLFHLLTGRPPFLSESLEGTLLQVLTSEPVSVRRLNPVVPRDLETICSKCLQKDPSRRYHSAQALADDLGRFLRQEPIHARPAHGLEKAWRWCQRRPTVAAILLLLGLSLVAGLSGILWEWRRAHRGEFALEQNLYAADVHLAQVALDDNNLGRAVALLEAHIPKSSAEPDLRGFEWRYLWSLCQGDERSILRGDGSIVSCVNFSPDGRLLAMAGFNRVVTIWEVASQRVITRLVELGGPVCRLAVSFSPDGKWLAAAGGTNLLVWDTANWKVAQRWDAQSGPWSGAAYQVAFAPDGGLLARLGEDVQRWETDTWRARTLIPGGIDSHRSLLACAPDGKRIATLNDDYIRFWDVVTGLEISKAVERTVQLFGMAFSPSGSSSGSCLAAVENSGKLRLLDPGTGATIAVTQAHNGFAQGVAFSRDGKTLATCGSDHLVRLWDVNSLRSIATLKGHQSEVWAVAFSPDGQTLASASKDGSVRLWSTQRKPESERRLDGRYVPKWFSPDGSILLTRGGDGWMRYWDTKTLRQRRAIPPLRLNAASFANAVSTDGKRLATSVSDGRVFLWDLEKGLCNATNQVDSNPANALAFSPDGKQLALSTGQYIDGAWRGSTKVLNLADGRLETLSSAYSGYRDSAGLAFSPDGRLLAGSGPDYTIRLWDLAAKKERAVLSGHTWDVISLAFSPDGKLLASASNDNSARLWDVVAGSEIATLAGHKTGVIQVAFSPDGRTLATSGNDRTVLLWSVTTHSQLLTLRPASEWTHFLFSPDGHTLATGGMSGQLELWSAPEGQAN